MHVSREGVDHLLDIDDIILRFFRDDMGGILILNEDGQVLYEDEKAARIRTEAKSWKTACPPVYEGQKGEVWDLAGIDSSVSYMVTTSTFTLEEGMIQVHYIVENSVYMGLCRDITTYSGVLKEEKERDGMTGLYNAGKFIRLKESLFKSLDAIALFFLDINNLKYVNDHYGHEKGDQLIMKAAQSLRQIEARNIMAFRIGGDEFAIAALHVTRKEAEKIRKEWEEALSEINRKEEGTGCVMACGMAYGEKGYDLGEVLARADQRMYEDKKQKKLEGQLTVKSPE